MTDGVPSISMVLRGAMPEPLHFAVVRPLTNEDIMSLVNAPAAPLPMIKKLRAIHHRQAALLAEGKTVREVAAIVGTTPQRITQLQADPAFQDLVKIYHEQIIANQIEDSARLRDKLINMAEIAVDEITDRLEDEQKLANMPLGELRQVAQLGLDRTVAPPKATTQVTTAPQTFTLDFGGKGIIKKPEPQVIDVTPKE